MGSRGTAPSTSEGPGNCSRVLSQICMGTQSWTSTFRLEVSQEYSGADGLRWLLYELGGTACSRASLDER